MGDASVNIYQTLQQCPRFCRCSASICPLDPDQKLRSYFPGEPKCTLSKSKRYAIGKNTNLPQKGLTKREWSARTYWQGLAEEEKHSKIAKLGQVSPFIPSVSEEKSKSSDRRRVNGKTL